MLLIINEIKVNDWMTAPVISVSPDIFVSAAQRLMSAAHIRHLPVVEHYHVVGILSIGDLREASPSDATSLSVWELNYLWEKITIEKVMTRHVYTLSPDDLIVDALQLMIDHKFSALPVVDENQALIGILTETDIFRMLLGIKEHVSLMM